MSSNSLSHDHHGKAAYQGRIPVISNFVDTVRDRDSEWVMRFGRGLGLAAIISGLLWGGILLLMRLVF